MVKQKKGILVVVASLIIVSFIFWNINKEEEDQIFIFDDILPLGGLAESVPIETDWDYNSENWKLTFEDDFDGEGTEVDSDKWEVQEYNRKNNDNGPDGYWKKDHVYKDGKGNLVIKFDEIENQNGDGDSKDYATGMVRSKNKFEQTYGKYEIRCKLPKEKGWWVAFWLMSDGIASEENGGTDGAEIDIFEGFGWHNTVYHTVHWDGYGNNHKSIYNLSRISNRDEYHTYTLIWTPTEYQYYVDGELAWVTKGGGVSEVNEYLKITGECSTYDWFATKSWAENPEDAELPDEFIVDYVKVYSYDEEKADEEGKEEEETVVEEDKEDENDSASEEQEDEDDDNETAAEKQENEEDENDTAAEEDEEGNNDTVVEEETVEVEKPVKAISVSSDKDKYNLGDEITWTVEAEGTGVRYMYYVSKDGRTIDSTRFLRDKQYNIVAEEPGVYRLLTFLIDKNGKRDLIHSEAINIIKEELSINGITYKKDGDNKATWTVDATGDSLRYSTYIIEDGRFIKILPYKSNNSGTHEMEKGKVYRVLVFVLDKYGHSTYKQSKSIIA